MANNYTGVSITARAAFDTLFTTPSSTQAIVKSLYFSNHDTGTYYVSAKAEISPGSSFFLINSGQVPPNTTLQIIDGNVVLNAECDLTVYCNTPSVVDVTASILKIS